MKGLLVITLCMALSGCGTMGGAVSGAGDDLKTVGGWIKKQGQ